MFNDEEEVVGAKRPIPGFLKIGTVYQIVLRNFTREGNFRAAKEMIRYLYDLGVTILYVTPFVEMDRDMDKAGWSPRQIQSGFDTPKNPYRISNYDKIDPEYGTDEDFKAFNDLAHVLGMRVVMDLVYLHCGPNNVLKDLCDDAFQKNPDGSVHTTIWNFPFLNFESKTVRRYLIDSMKHWIRLGCDGFRCDVGDEVPIDFWVEAVTECRELNPELTMINEGTKIEWLDKAFDACYAWPWSFTIRDAIVHKKGTKPLAERMNEVREYEAKLPKNALLFCFVDNHDTANDDGENRFDRLNTEDAGNAAFVLTFLRKGLPLVFNGNEIADNSLSSFFAPVEHPDRANKSINWGRAMQPAGRHRHSLIYALTRLRKDEIAFSLGTMEWLQEGEKKNVVSFLRRCSGRVFFVSANLSNEEVTVKYKKIRPSDDVFYRVCERYEILEDGTCKIGPYGYIAIQLLEDEN